MIEFSTPEATLANAALAAAHGCAHVIGTTGLSAEQERGLRALAARKMPIVWAPNMSLGVNLLLGLVEQVARTLDPRFDIEILEMHHRHKVDAPSGTALALAGRPRVAAEPLRRRRGPVTGRHHRRPRAGAIGFAVLRGGDAVGDHSVMFGGTGERLEFAHIATDRRIYAWARYGRLCGPPGSRPGSTGWRRCSACGQAAPSGYPAAAVCIGA